MYADAIVDAIAWNQIESVQYKQSKEISELYTVIFELGKEFESVSTRSNSRSHKIFSKCYIISDEAAAAY